MRPSNEQLNKAGKILRDNKADKEAYSIVSNWRALHNYPLSHFRRSLYRRIEGNNKEKKYLTAQRLKRMPTIIDKLFRESKLELSRMQDIGGVRAILPNVKEVRDLEKKCKKNNKSYQLVNDGKDYINVPKSSGYRGIHLIYKYHNEDPQFNNLRIELQIRTKLQHIWATSVEIAGIIRNEDLKSSLGNKEWEEFFKYMSSAFALQESTSVLESHKNLSKQEIYTQIYNMSLKLAVKETLKALPATISQNKIKSSKEHLYCILILNPEEKQTEIKKFFSLEQAKKEYENIEQSILDKKQIQVVLIEIDKVSNLKKTYQNFFLDTAEFLKELEKIEKLTSQTLPK